ncbi:MAG TPA: hemerythrin domain-containing protein [Ilumatobacteraceae bacterium]|nr:hemerythrin domain-containing protein [Ilumatobacteraceae bacterium]
MCDYCDCRAQPEIQALSNEHERILEVVGKLRRNEGETADRLDQSLDALAELLGTHTAREEAGIFSRLRSAQIDDGYLDRFESDHTLIDQTLVAAKADHRRIEALLVIVTNHILHEETDMYPAARQILGPADWEQIDRAVASLTIGGGSRGLPVTASQRTRASTP